MNARLPIPTSDDFWLIERDGRTLITPSKTKFDWSVDERALRSVIVDSTSGEVLSVSFDKFFNYGEEALAGDHMRLLRDALADPNAPVRFTEKLDGSTCVRSVIDGKVIFRTRGTHDGGDFGPHMQAVAEAKYPVLLDPDFMPDHSMLFEFVSANPEFRIVIRYDEDDLVLLAVRQHADLRLYDWEELEVLAGAYSLNLVKLVELPSDVHGLVSAVRDWQGSEGVVVRVPDEHGVPDQVYMKVKSAAYLLLHRMRTQLSAKGVREMCEIEDVQSLDDFKAIVLAQGADWELLVDTEPLVEAYLASQAATRERLAQLADDVERLRPSLTGDEREQRKQFAVGFATKLEDSIETPVAFHLYNGNERAAFLALRSRRLDRDFAELEASERGRTALAEADA